MKLLTRKPLSKNVNKRIYQHKESMFGKVVSIDRDARLAIVRIQGTQEDIYLPWSKNFEDVPPFVRINNPVLIQMVKGNKLRLEIVGNGGMLPTPVDGSSVLSTNPASANAIITGASVFVHELGGMFLRITYGTVRIDDVLYTLPGILMGNPSLGVMGSNPTELMGITGGIVELDPAPAAPNFRIDMISMGEDRILDITKGAEAPSDPVAPTLENNHVLISYILVPYETVDLRQSYIGNAFADSYMAEFYLTMPDMATDWTQVVEGPPGTWTLPTAQKQVTGTVTILDQYGKPLYGTYSVKVEIDDGNGYLNGSTNPIYLTVVNGTSGNTFTYERIGVDGLVVLGPTLDSSPFIKISLTVNPSYLGYRFLELYNSNVPPDLMIG